MLYELICAARYFPFARGNEEMQHTRCDDRNRWISHRDTLFCPRPPLVASSRVDRCDPENLTTRYTT